MDLTNLRVGQGFDTHAFGSQTGELHLACLVWPDQQLLEGHSDGDVAAHALCDALLSATGLGDLGSIFGVDRPEVAGALGSELLGEVKRLLDADGWHIINATVQILGNRPKVGPRRAEAMARLSEILGAPVSVTATTTDRLGFLGRGEGLSALATALVVQGN